MSKKLPWFNEGLHFECTGCGQCCTGAPGYVWISPEEISQIATFLDISIEDFTKNYTRVVGDKISLIEKPITFDCVFLSERKCQIYSARPKQCRTFPWWPENLQAPHSWKAAARLCEGIHNEAPLISIDVIQEQLNIHTKSSS